MKYLILGITFISLTNIVNAGTNSSSHVEINQERKVARGSLSAARFSDNPLDQIGCSTTTRLVNEDEEYTYGFCQASIGTDNENLEHIFCQIKYQQAKMLSQVGTISPSSYIAFKWKTEKTVVIVDGVEQEVDTNYCTVLRVSNQSMHINALDVINDQQNVSVWLQDKVYLSGDMIKFNGNIYIAKYWTKGNEPKAAEGNPWALVTNN